jgi:hypothetical protein
MRYSKSNERDFSFYLSNRHSFNFSGTLNPVEPVYDKDGVDGKEAFFSIENNGKNKPTKHPNILSSLLLSKASVNFNIKMWAESRSDGTLPYHLLLDIQREFKAPDWVITAVENQKAKLWKL